MSRRRNRWLALTFSVLFSCVAARAQDVQFLPEIDAHLKLNSMVRVYFECKDDRDGGDSTQATNGPSIQLYLKPILKLKRITAFDLDDSKTKALVLEAGYRYITAPNAPTDNRFLTAVTFNAHLKPGYLSTDTTRADMDWQRGTGDRLALNQERM